MNRQFGAMHPPPNTDAVIVLRPRLITRRRIAQLTGVASAQLAVQAIGFSAGIVLVRAMEPAQYGFYTLALSLASVATIVTDLGLGTAVIAIGGRLQGTPGDLHALAADARDLHARLARWTLPLLLSACAFMLLRQSAAPGQALLLALLLVVTAWFNVDGSIALSVVRLLGHVRLQQKVDLTLNTGKLALLALAAAWWLDATLACLVNVVIAAAYATVLRRHLAAQAPLSAAAGAHAASQRAGAHQAALRKHLWKQGPNALYFVLSSQISLWLIGLFGSAERVAEVGALSRLAAVFSIVGAVSAGLVLPHFARTRPAAELGSAFTAVNLFYALLLALLLAAATRFPAQILWVLGGHYGGLQSELLWMVAASALAAWGGALYSMGCARGWVLPLSISVSTGTLVTVLAALTVDVSTVSGTFKINTATALASTAVTFSYLVWRLRRQTLLPDAKHDSN